MRVLITGAGGMVGSTLASTLGSDAVPFTRSDLDVTDAGAVDAAVSTVRPTAIVNAAAYTDVDGAEADPDRAYAVNVTGAQNVAVAAGRAGAACLHISTDFVFDGTLGRPYAETDLPNPICVYAASKLEGERLAAAHGSAIARTAWVYGVGHRTFLSQILGLAREGKTLHVVTDQHGSPTWVRDLVGGIMQWLANPQPGIFHLAGGGACSRFEFARAIVEAAGLDPQGVQPITTAEAPARPAPRPAYAPLVAPAWTAAGYTPLRDWRDALREAIKEF